MDMMVNWNCCLALSAHQPSSCQGKVAGPWRPPTENATLAGLPQFVCLCGFLISRFPGSEGRTRLRLPYECFAVTRSIECTPRRVAVAHRRCHIALKTSAALILTVGGVCKLCSRERPAAPPGSAVIPPSPVARMPDGCLRQGQRHPWIMDGIRGME
jgi:hypothetical protein